MIERPKRLPGESKMEFMARCNIDRLPADYARIEKAARKRERKRHARVTARNEAASDPIADIRKWKREVLERTGIIEVTWRSSYTGRWPRTKRQMRLAARRGQA